MATLKDIATTLGTSIRTVSRALNDSGYVRADLRAQIRETAERLGYRPNPTARGLRLGRSEEVVVIAGTVDELHMAKLSTIERTARSHGLRTTMIMTGGPPSKRSEAPWIISELESRHPTGVICLQGQRGISRHVQETLRDRIPVVILDPQPATHTGDLQVLIDRPSGVREAVHHLAACGRRRIGYVGPAGSTNRTDGYRTAMDELGFEALEFDVPETVSYRTIVAEVLQRAGTLDAVQVYSDLRAMEFMAGLHDAGVRIPADVAVVGFDDRAAAQYAWPPLSTVAQPNDATGAAAVQLIVEALAGHREQQPIVVPTHLVVRESSKELS